MTAYALIADAHARGIKLWEESGQLKLKAPKGALTEEFREKLITNKEAILAFLGQVSTNSDIPPLVPVDRDALEVLPLSYAQERLWFIDQLEPGSSGYNVPVASLVIGKYNVGDIESALNTIIKRHENLRSVFPTENGHAKQNILDHLDLQVQQVDLVDCPSKQQIDKAGELCQAAAGEPFDLATGPLIRALLIKLAADRQILFLNMHHIISDGWSLNVLFDELASLLKLQANDTAAQLGPLPIQYLDYSVWQRKWLEDGGVLERQLTYWKEKLAGMSQALDLFTDFPRPKQRDFIGATKNFSLDIKLTGQLKSLAEEQQCTLYMVVLAIFKVLLYRYSGQQDICIGTPIANRQHHETESLIGMFANTLPLRSELQSDAAFSEFLQTVKCTCLDAYEHQDAPFEKIVDAVGVERTLAVNPLFQVMLVLQNTPSTSHQGLFQPFPLSTSISQFDITLELTETGQGIDGKVEYSTALYQAETAKRLTEHFVQLCKAAVEAPDRKISDLVYLSEAEKQRLLIEYNATQADYPSEYCLHDLFIQQVERTPEATAAIFDGKSLSYRELYNRSRLLALYLQSRNVRADTFVGICMERSLDMLVGLLGILQAGGAYVPLDPTYPDERLLYMLEDTGAEIVLTQAQLQEKLSNMVPDSTELVELDQQWSMIAEAGISAGVAQTLQPTDPSDLAYVIYTSGSTGRPKGVAIEHASASAMLHWASSVYSSQELAGVLAATSICFDLSVYELFLPLANGGRVILTSNVLGLLDLSGAADVSLINTVPSAMEELLKLGAIPGSVLTINLAGEPLSTELVDRLYTIESVRKVYDLYGPSEDTTYSTYTLRQPDGKPTIGKPIANTKIYILDRSGQVQPVGVPGELHIAGAGLARGYLNREALTAEKFVANPFEPGTRMYRTGDLARWLDDGNIEYLGRIDTQVKVRGFRIETGEIESRLKRYTGIDDAVVVVQGEGGDKQLIAFYVATKTQGKSISSPKVAELKAHLQQYLPEYMIPAGFMCIDSIPVTQNGKIDRRALEQQKVELSSSKTYAAPRDQLESDLVKIWADLLKLDSDRIGINDNFFELGGHSLLATQLNSQIRSQLDAELPLKMLFDINTIAETAGVINAIKCQHEWSSTDSTVSEEEFEESSL